MMIRNGIQTAAIAVAIALTSAACSQDQGGGSSTDSYTYGTTSSTGDWAEWTIEGSALSVLWQDISLTGDLERTFTVKATCVTADATFGYRTCTISSFACADGTATCTGTEGADITQFHTFEIPGVALMVHAPKSTTTDSVNNDDIHFGFATSTASCKDDVSGDYVYARMNVGDNDIFGLYRTDADLLNVTHAVFQYSGSDLTTKQLAYNASSGGTLTLTDGGCTNGLRQRTSPGGKFRAFLTAAGTFILDMPEGNGGIVSFKTENAASLSDFASKEWNGISFPDNGKPQLIYAKSTTESGSAIALTEVKMLKDGTSTTLTSSLPSFSAVGDSAPAAYTSSGNALVTDYPNPASLPGIFKLAGGTDTNTIIAGMKFSGKTIAFGVNLNTRDGGIKNTGNFVIFEK